MKNKIVILSNASSIHTIQWALYLKKQGLEVDVISQHPTNNWFIDDVPVHFLPYQGSRGYFFNVCALKILLKKIKPDILNAHYASGYGTTARLANFHPYVLSVWGSDVHDFPYRSLFHKRLLIKNLAAADTIASTSNNMAMQTELFLNKYKTIYITPFGVDLNKFKIECSSSESKKNDVSITIGTVKTLKHIYGIDVLINSLSIVYHNISKKAPFLAQKLQFRIVGGGPDFSKLKALATQLGINHITNFVGEVPHDQVPFELEKLDIYIALSRQESFGVAVIEAQAMGMPVVVSNVGGLPEVVIDGETGFIVESENPMQAAEKIIKLIFDDVLRVKMGIQAERFVYENFTWESCAKKMLQVFEETLSNSKD